VECDSVLRRTVRLMPVLRGSPAEGYLQVGEASVSPPRVKVEGPERLVREMESLRTVPVSIRDARAPVSREVEVSVGELEGIRLTPDRVTVSVPVEPRESFRLPSVPVLVRGAGTRGRVSWEPAEVTVEVMGARRIFEELQAADVNLVIDATGLAPGYYEYLLEADTGRWVRLVPFSLGPQISTGEGSAASRSRELRGTLPLPEPLTVSSLSPHTFHLLVR
jgi:YbbR domain-containing protein